MVSLRAFVYKWVIGSLNLGKASQSNFALGYLFYVGVNVTRAQLVLRVSLVWDNIYGEIFHELRKICVNLRYREIKRMLQLLKPLSVVDYFVCRELEHLFCKFFENRITCHLWGMCCKGNKTVLLSRKFTACFRTKNGVFSQIIVLRRLVELKRRGS